MSQKEIVGKMATAISMHGAKNVYFKDVFIRGFRTGIEATDSTFFMGGSNIQGCGIGVALNNSDAVFHGTSIIDNAIDMVVNKSRAYLINSLARRVLELLPKGDYRINPYLIENLAFNVINTRDIQEKRRRLSTLFNALKKYQHIWVIYSIIKEILRLAGYLV